MSRFNKLSHVIWHCQYHIVWVPIYRHSILIGVISEELQECLYVCSGKSGCIIEVVNVQKDHILLIVMVSSKVSI